MLLLLLLHLQNSFVPLVRMDADYLSLVDIPPRVSFPCEKDLHHYINPHVHRGSFPELLLVHVDPQRFEEAASRAGYS